MCNNQIDGKESMGKLATYIFMVCLIFAIGYILITAIIGVIDFIIAVKSLLK